MTRVLRPRPRANPLSGLRFMSQFKFKLQPCPSGQMLSFVEDLERTILKVRSVRSRSTYCSHRRNTTRRYDFHPQIHSPLLRAPHPLVHGALPSPLRQPTRTTGERCSLTVPDGRDVQQQRVVQPVPHVLDVGRRNSMFVYVPVRVARASVPGSGAVVDGLGGETFERVKMGT